MKPIYNTDIGFAHAVRYHDAMVRAWAKRTGRCGRSGGYSYHPNDVPAYIDLPTNDDRGRAEVILFKANPLKHGESYFAYLASPKPEHTAVGTSYLGKGVITTFNGELLATVTRITSYRVRETYLTSTRGSFWAIGIDGRTYYGRHNGRGMYCRMRLAKWVDEFDIQQHTSEGWEPVNCETTWSDAKRSLDEYRANCIMGTPFRIKRNKVRQL